MTVNAAHARGPKRCTLPPPTNDSPTITDAGTARTNTERCPHTLPGCPTIRCAQRTGHHGMCWHVTRTPTYAAAYWEQPQ